MGVTTKKYRVSVSFCPEMMIFSKIVASQLWMLSENLSLLKPVKNHIRDTYV
jgi:hypothetical protein